MKFLNPAWLWLLLGIPVLIIIYMIKAQHEDRPVSSTYIWRLSSRFMKKRLPMQKISRILAFVMQLAVITAAALAAARPAVSNGAACDYIAIIDASASMEICDEAGVSRFDYAIAAVEELSDKITEGHTVSVIVADDSPYYLVRTSESVNEVKLALSHAQCSLGETNMESAVGLADLVCAESSNAQVLLYSDCDYSAENIQVINLNKGEWNVEVTSLSAEEKDGQTYFTAALVSYNLDATLTVGLKIDGSVEDARFAECKKDSVTEVKFTVEDLEAYDTAEVFVEAEDGIDADNSFALCNKTGENGGVLLVSASPLYLESALKALGNCDVTVVSSIDETDLSGYDIYVFDGIYPETYPTDGSVILFGTGSLPAGLTAGITSDTQSELSMDGTVASELYSGLFFENTYVTDYSELFGGSDWQMLMYCDNAAVFATRETDYGMHFSVFSFDVHNSNLPMQTDFVMLMRNLVSYSLPELLKDMDYAVGDTVKMTVLPSTVNMYLEYPDESVKALSISSQYASLKPENTGIYTAVRSSADGGEYADFFVHISAGEMSRTDGGTLQANVPTAVAGEEKEAMSELWLWIAVAALVLVLTEWWWYYREQY